MLRSITEAERVLRGKPSGHQWVFSRFSLYGCYQMSEAMNDKFPVTHIHSGERFRAVYFPEGQHESRLTDEMLRVFTEYPVRRSDFEWPVDVVSVPKNQEDIRYLIFPEDVNSGKMNTLRETVYYSLKRSSQKLVKMEWTDTLNQQLCRSFLNNLSYLHHHGYVYNDFNIHQIRMNSQTGRCHFRFHDQIRKIGEKGEEQIIDVDAIAPEFAPPYIFSDSYDRIPDYSVDCYSAAAVLFRLMFGKLPYEGIAMEGYGHIFDLDWDTEETVHDTYFRNYHLVPYFIFDPFHKENSLSLMSQNDNVRELWNQLHDSVKQMFLNTFSESSAAKNVSQTTYYSIDEWIHSLEKHCWKG